MGQLEISHLKNRAETFKNRLKLEKYKSTDSK